MSFSVDESGFDSTTPAADTNSDAKASAAACPLRVLGIALIVEEKVGQGARIICRYPASTSSSSNLWDNLSSRVFLKMFRPKPALCNQPMTVRIGKTIVCCYAVLMQPQQQSSSSVSAPARTISAIETVTTATKETTEDVKTTDPARYEKDNENKDEKEQGGLISKPNVSKDSDEKGETSITEKNIEASNEEKETKKTRETTESEPKNEKDNDTMENEPKNSTRFKDLCNSELVLFSVVVALEASSVSAVASSSLSESEDLDDSPEFHPGKAGYHQSDNNQRLAHMSYQRREATPARRAVRKVHASLYRLCRALKREELRCRYVHRQSTMLWRIRSSLYGNDLDGSKDERDEHHCEDETEAEQAVHQVEEQDENLSLAGPPAAGSTTAGGLVTSASAFSSSSDSSMATPPIVAGAAATSNLPPSVIPGGSTRSSITTAAAAAASGSVASSSLNPRHVRGSSTGTFHSAAPSLSSLGSVSSQPGTPILPSSLMATPPLTTSASSVWGTPAEAVPGAPPPPPPVTSSALTTPSIVSTSTTTIGGGRMTATTATQASSTGRLRSSSSVSAHETPMEKDSHRQAVLELMMAAKEEHMEDLRKDGDGDDDDDDDDDPSDHKKIEEVPTNVDPAMPALPPMQGNLLVELAQTYHGLSGDDMDDLSPATTLHSGLLASRKKIRHGGTVYINNHTAVHIDSLLEPSDDAMTKITSSTTRFRLLQSAPYPPPPPATATSLVQPYHTILFPHLSMLELQEIVRSSVVDVGGRHRVHPTVSLMSSLSLSTDRSSQPNQHERSRSPIPPSRRRLFRFLSCYHAKKSLREIATESGMPLDSVLNMAGQLVEDGTCVLALPLTAQSCLAFGSCHRPSSKGGGAIRCMKSLAMPFAQRFGPQVPIALAISALTDGGGAARLSVGDAIARASISPTTGTSSSSSLSSSASPHATIGRLIACTLLQGNIQSHVMSDRRKTDALSSLLATTTATSTSPIIATTTPDRSRHGSYNDWGNVEQPQPQSTDFGPSLLSVAVDETLYEMAVWLVAHGVIVELREYLTAVSPSGVNPHANSSSESAELPHAPTRSAEEVMYDELRAKQVLCGTTSMQALCSSLGMDMGRLKRFKDWGLQEHKLVVVTRVPTESDDWGTP